MYQHVSCDVDLHFLCVQKVGWEIKMLSCTQAEAGGYKEVIAQVSRAMGSWASVIPIREPSGTQWVFQIWYVPCKHMPMVRPGIPRVCICVRVCVCVSLAGHW